MKNRTVIAIALGFGMPAAWLGGAMLQLHADRLEIKQARQNEWQANGLEDECKATLNSSLRTSMVEASNGDYSLVVHGGRRLVCEEKDVRIISQPTATTPIVLGCYHE